MIKTWTIGRTVSFGPHALLTADEHAILCRLLQCKLCQFRIIYHKLSHEQFCKTNGKYQSQCYQFSLPFHCLIRAVKTILLSFRLTCYPTGRSKNVKYCISSDVHFSNKKLLWICREHGRELFKLFYYVADIPIRTTIALVPKCSDFIRSCELSSSSEDEDNELNDSWSVKISYSPEVLLNSSKRIMKAKLSNDLMANTNCQEGSNDEVHRYHNACIPKYKDNTYSKSNRKARFPVGSPVTAVYHLITYATACKLERRNRIWEVAACRRNFDRIQRILKSGSHDSIENDSDDDSNDESLSNSHPNILVSTSSAESVAVTTETPVTSVAEIPPKNHASYNIHETSYTPYESVYDNFKDIGFGCSVLPCECISLTPIS